MLAVMILKRVKFYDYEQTKQIGILRILASRRYEGRCHNAFVCIIRSLACIGLFWIFVEKIYKLVWLRHVAL